MPTGYDAMTGKNQSLLLPSQVQIVLHHCLHKFLEAGLGPPSEDLPCLARVSFECIDLRWTEIAGVVLYTAFPIDFGNAGGKFEKLPHRVTLTRGDD